MTLHTEGFTGLPTRVYQAVLAGQGFGIADLRPSIDLVYRIRTAPLSPGDDCAHPMLHQGQRNHDAD